jgi:T5SS/PEP-CTERM-associated repeat protein
MLSGYTRRVSLEATTMTMHCHRTIAATAALIVIFLTELEIVRADVPVELTRIGNPIWRPTDFHLFTAPCEPASAFEATADSIVPINAPPRNPPYDDVLAERIAAAGFQDSSTFVPSDIAGEPSGIYYAFLLIPDPGETGSSRDFASGPIIPNRLFPINDNTDILRNGVVVDGELDGQFPRAVGFDGKSHDWALFCDDAVFFPPGTELPGSYEWRSTLRDREGNGWNVVAPFQVIPLAGDFNQSGVVDAADFVEWRKNDGLPAAYDVWRANFGLTSGSGSMTGIVIPEPATVRILAMGIAMVFTCRRTRDAFFAMRMATEGQRTIYGSWSMTVLGRSAQVCRGWSLLAVWLVALVADARAADMFWVIGRDNNPNGVFSDAENWTTPAPFSSPPPDANDDAHFGVTTSSLLPEFYTVTFTNSPTNRMLVVEDDRVTFDLNGHTYTLQPVITPTPTSVMLGTVVGRSGRLTVTDGLVSLPFEADLEIGSVAGASGVLTVTTGGLVLGSPEVFVGASGNGTLNINNNGDLIASNTTLGVNSNVTGTATISGGGSSLLANSLTVGLQGTGTLNVMLGGRVDSAGSTIGHLPGSMGTATVDGSGSKWTDGTGLRLASGTLNITNGGRIESERSSVGLASIDIGGPGPNTATVTGANSAWISGFMAIGSGTQGTLNISAGGLVNSDTGVIGEQTAFRGAAGAVNLSDAPSRWINSGDLIIGSSGSGKLNINGGRVETTNGIIGDEGHVRQGGDIGEGIVTVNGANSLWTNSGDLVIGRGGIGTLNITAGGRVESSTGTIAVGDLNAFGPNEGHVTVDGERGISSWINSGEIVIRSARAASLNITNGGQVQSASGLVGGSVGIGPIVTVDGSNAEGFDSQWVISGDLELGRNATLNITDGARVENASGTIGFLVNVSGPNSRWINSGDLVGNEEQGTLSISNGARVESFNAAVGRSVAVSNPGSKWVNSGQLEVGRMLAGTLNVTNGGRVQNTSGFIGNANEGLFAPQADVIVDGAGSEWVNLGELSVGRRGTGTLTVTNGGRVTSTNSFLGFGNLTGGVVEVAEANSSWTMSGQLTMRSGRLSIRSGGTVSVAGDTVFVSDGVTLNLEGGTFETNAVRFESAGVFRFVSGTLHTSLFGASLVNQGGILAPGHSAGSTVVNGDYTQQAGATLAIEIGGTTPSTQYDRVTVNGNAVLGGNLQLSMLNGFVPTPTDRFFIFEANNPFALTSVSGAFANVANGQRLTTTDGLASFLVHYGTGSAFSPRQIVLTNVLPAVPGDFNLDGIVNHLDIDRLAFAAHNDPNNLFYDLNGDGRVTYSVGPGGAIASDSDVLIRSILRTEYGDLDLNGEVFLADLNEFATNYRQPGLFGWAQGNINGSPEDGTTASPRVFLSDLVALATHWRFGVGTGSSSGGAVPEPNGLQLALVTALIALARSARCGPSSPANARTASCFVLR